MLDVETEMNRLQRWARFARPDNSWTQYFSHTRPSAKPRTIQPLKKKMVLKLRTEIDQICITQFFRHCLFSTTFVRFWFFRETSYLKEKRVS